MHNWFIGLQIGNVCLIGGNPTRGVWLFEGDMI